MFRRPSSALFVMLLALVLAGRTGACAVRHYGQWHRGRRFGAGGRRRRRDRAHGGRPHDDHRRGCRRHLPDRERRRQPAGHRAGLRGRPRSRPSSPASRWCCAPRPSPIRWWSPPRVAPSACRAPRVPPSSPRPSWPTSAAGALDDALRTTPGLQPVPPLVVARRQPHHAGRHAARRVGLRRQPHARPRRRRAAERSVRQLGLLEPHAAGRGRSRRSGARRDRRSLRRRRAGRRHSGADVRSRTAPRARAAIEGGSFDTFRGSLFGGVREARLGRVGRVRGHDHRRRLHRRARGARPDRYPRRQRLPDGLRRPPASRPEPGTPG